MFEKTLKQGSGFCEEFIEEIISMTKRLFDGEFVKLTFGKNIPIIIHKLEYHNDTLSWTLKSNLEELADEFAEWVRSLGQD